MRPKFVEVTAPGFDLQLGVGQGSEPVHAQAFVAELPVEALDEGVFDRLAWTNELQRDTTLLGPEIERLSGELRSVVAEDTAGEAAFPGRLAGRAPLMSASASPTILPGALALLQQYQAIATALYLAGARQGSVSAHDSTERRRHVEILQGCSWHMGDAAA